MISLHIRVGVFSSMLSSQLSTAKCFWLKSSDCFYLIYLVNYFSNQRMNNFLLKWCKMSDELMYPTLLHMLFISYSCQVIKLIKLNLFARRIVIKVYPEPTPKWKNLLLYICIYKINWNSLKVFFYNFS